MATDPSASTAAKLPRSRLCNSLQSRPATEQPYLFEALRELSFETCLEVAGSTLRIGLAASAWQLEQARMLLEHFQPLNRKILSAVANPVTDHERAVAVALHVTPSQNHQRAQGVITLRRDNEAGLALDQKHHVVLEEMRARGARLVEVETFAFNHKMPLDTLLEPMIKALTSTVDAWGATDILAECPRPDAAFYCAHLGFKRVHKLNDSKATHILLHLSATRIARLQTRILAPR
ncbi:hypothetical protein GCM10027046_35000 [Uliginosibacterium flavum]|uniref:N-acyl amino acid synthase FeeM catalytic core domain-containing protein n=1 Tax=Uliginosibacterium flavum TaxID=1396831 RepID=A0ABV2TMC4_9RHOO